MSTDMTEQTERESAMDQALQELDRLDQDIEKVEQAAVTDIITTFDGLLAALEQQRLQALEELKKKVAPAKSSIEDTRANLLESQELIRTHRSIAEREIGVTACSEMGYMPVAKKKRVEYMDSSVVVPADAQAIATTTFAVSPDAVSAAQTAIAQLELSDLSATPQEEKLTEEQRKPSETPPPATGDASGSGPMASVGTKYVPPSLRDDASKGCDEAATIRVTNLSEDLLESDLQELFQPFGPISRIYLDKDEITGQSKGIAFINFSRREDAAQAISGVSGLICDHLILNVEWAKPSEQQ